LITRIVQEIFSKKDDISVDDLVSLQREVSQALLNNEAYWTDQIASETELKNVIEKVL
jgi:hypothetical protein